MRSEAQAVSSGDRQFPIFQIGKRVFLSIERASGGSAPVELGDARSLDIVAGDFVFRLHQMRENVHPPHPLSVEQDGIGALPDLLSLSTAQWCHFLQHLFGMAASVLRLSADDRFIDTAVQLLNAASRQFQISLHQIAGIKEKVAVAPRRANLSPDELFIFFDDGNLTVGRVEIVQDALLHPASRDRLIGIRSSKTVAGQRAILLGAGSITRVEVDTRNYASFQEFYESHERNNFDLAALLMQLAEPEPAFLLNIADDRRPPNRLHDRRSSVRLEVTSGFSLENGFFASGWFFDQEEQVSEVVVVDYSLEEANLINSWKIFHARVEIDSKVTAIRRFVAFAPRRPGQKPPEEVRIRVSLKNGSSYVLAPKNAPTEILSRRDAILEDIAGYAFTMDQFNEVFRPAIEPLQKRLNDLQHIREKRELGNRSDRTTSIIIPIYREMVFLRSQLMAFALDDYVRDCCEIIYCVDDPNIALSFSSTMMAYSSAFPLDVKVLTLARNGGYALANNLAARTAAGETLVLLNSDVIPVRPGWINVGLSLLDGLPRYSVLGPKLLYPDNTIQHAGMYFQRTDAQFWQNMHFSKGYGRELPSANIDREVPAVTGACMFVKKSDYLEVGGFSDDYIVGDFEDSDLCLKLRQKGGLAFYTAGAELYHFERQSMDTDGSRPVAATTMYNEALHASKWDAVIPSVNEVAIAYRDGRRPAV